uniref:Uncharacterized protein n=1 Tax=Leersia perrieri TaxID=77586 RepID=A0A0D9XZH1_9ORYZ
MGKDEVTNKGGAIGAPHKVFSLAKRSCGHTSVITRRGYSHRAIEGTPVVKFEAKELRMFTFTETTESLIDMYKENA